MTKTFLSGPSEKCERNRPGCGRHARRYTRTPARRVSAPEATDVPFGLKTAVAADWRAGVASELSLKADQVTKICPLIEESGRAMDSLRRKTTQEERARRAEATREIAALLTPEQQIKLEKRKRCTAYISTGRVR